VQVFLSVNGRQADPAAPSLAPTDRGALAGEGAYEALRTYSRRPFALGRHLARLEASLQRLAIPCPDLALLGREIGAAIAAVEASEVRVRVTVTAGPGLPAPAGLGAATDPVRIIDARPLQVEPTPGGTPVRAITLPWRLIPGPLRGVKSTSLAATAVARRHAATSGADDGLWTDLDGRYLEACAASLLLGEAGSLCTAPLDTGVLDGVTRAALLQLATEHGVAVDERPLARAELLRGGGFLAASSQPWRPLGRLDADPIPPPAEATGLRLALELERRAHAGWDPE